jgi:hypothetical protein
LVGIAALAISCPARQEPPLSVPGEREPAAPDLARPPSAVSSSMWRLALLTNRLARLDDPAPLTADELQHIRAVVDDVEKIARGLQVDPSARKHPLVRRGIEPFLRDVTLAQAGLVKDPADLAPVRALSSSCRQCHRGGQPPAPFAW